MSLLDLFSINQGSAETPGLFCTITLAGVPVPKGRPRFRYVKGNAAGRPGFVTVYTPKETEAYEEALKWKGKAAMKGRKPLEGAVAVRIFVMLPVPKSWPIKKRDAALVGKIRPIGRPDWDNFAKAIDGLNQTVWTDDSQIVMALVIKEYCERPGLIVEVYALD